MISTIAIIVLSVLVVILGYTTINLMRKNERQEDIVVGYLQYLDQLSRVIEVSNDKLSKLDSRGSFESDDEVGFFFNGIKQIQEILNEFQLKNL